MQISKALIEDFYSHMEWADASVWQMVPNVNDDSPDETLKDLLAHIHTTQSGFNNVWRAEELVRKRASDFANLSEIRDWARAFYEQMPSMIDALDEHQLGADVPVPWAKYFARKLGTDIAVTTLGETMLQVAMHTHYHRAQVNTRLRQLGIEPPLVDYIGWVWSSRPEPTW